MAMVTCLNLDRSSPKTATARSVWRAICGLPAFWLSASLLLGADAPRGGVEIRFLSVSSARDTNPSSADAQPWPAAGDRGPREQPAPATREKVTLRVRNITSTRAATPPRMECEVARSSPPVTVQDTRDAHPLCDQTTAVGKPQSFPEVQWASMQTEAKPLASDRAAVAAPPAAKPSAETSPLEMARRPEPLRATAESAATLTIRSRKFAEGPAKRLTRPPVVDAERLTPLPPVAPSSAVKAEPAQVGPFQVVDQAEEFTVPIRRSKLLRIQTGIRQVVVVDPTVCNVVQFTPQEILIVGKGQGATHVTFWFDDGRQEPATYLVRVTPDPEAQRQREQLCAAIERHLAGMFPNRNLRAIPSRDQVFLQGDVRDAHEAARILEAVRALAFAPAAGPGAHGTLVNELPAGQTDEGSSTAPVQVVNLLNIPVTR